MKDRGRTFAHFPVCSSQVFKLLGRIHYLYVACETGSWIFRDEQRANSMQRADKDFCHWTINARPVNYGHQPEKGIDNIVAAF